MATLNRTKIKLSFTSKCILTAIAFLTKLLYMTLRIDVDAKTVKILKSPKSSALFCWHGSIPMLPYVNTYLRNSQQITGLISDSRDGAYLENFFSHFNVTAVRGSSSKNGKRAAIEIIRILRDGGNICITPDGPRGPARKVKGGMFTVVCHAPESRMVFLKITFGKCRVFSSWDKFAIPYPFSKVTIKAIEYKNSSDFLAEAKKRDTTVEALAEEYLG